MLSSSPSSGNPAGAERYRIGKFEVIVEARQVLRDGEEVHLTELSFDVLVVLLRRAPAIVSKKELMREVWPGVVVEPDTVKKRIGLLRESLGDDDPSNPLIRVARGRGYGIAANVEGLGGAGSALAAPRWRKLPIALGASALVLSVLAIVLVAWTAGDAEEQPTETDPRPAPGAVAGTGPGPESSAPIQVEEIDPVAYQSYLEGKVLRRASQDFAAASRALETAVDIEPQFAAAWAELALARIGNLPAADAGTPEAMEYSVRQPAQRALQLDPSLPEAIAAAAAVAIHLDWDWAGAESLLNRGLAISPGNDYLQAWQAILSGINGDLDESIRLLKPAVARDVTYARLHYSLGLRYYQAGRFREAIQAYRQALELDPSSPYAHLGIGRIRALQGDHAAALREVSLEPDPFFRLYGTVLAHTAAGDESGAAAALEELEGRRDGCCNYWMGSLHAFMGSPDVAFRYLEAALQSRERGLLDIRIDPLLERIRSDSRYRDLLSAMNLE